MNTTPAPIIDQYKPIASPARDYLRRKLAQLLDAPEVKAFSELDARFIAAQKHRISYRAEQDRLFKEFRRLKKLQDGSFDNSQAYLAAKKAYDDFKKSKGAVLSGFRDALSNDISNTEGREVCLAALRIFKAPLDDLIAAELAAEAARLQKAGFVVKGQPTTAGIELLKKQANLQFAAKTRCGENDHHFYEAVRDALSWLL